MSTTRRPIEPLLWMLFSAGGMASALLLPALIFLFAFAIPLGWATLDYTHLRSLLTHPLTRVALFGICTLSLFHWAHRFKYTLYDGLQVKHLNEMLNTFCYGGAIIGTIIAAFVLF